MSSTLASIVTPILGDYIYIGGGFLVAVVVVLLILMVFRRR